MKFPNRIKEIREKKNYEIKDIAGHVGIDEKELNDIETGNANPKFSILNKIAGVLNCEVIDLMERRTVDTMRRDGDGSISKFEKLQIDYYTLIEKYEDLKKKYDELVAKSS